MSKQLSETPRIHETAKVEASTIGRYTEIAEFCRIRECEIGDYSYVMEHGHLWNVAIGKFSNIAAFVRINATNHPVERATLHHFTYRAGDYWPGDAEHETDFFTARRARPVTIGHDTWIGHGATILPGITIGNGAVIGTGAVVSKDVAPYTIVGGAGQADPRAFCRRNRCCHGQACVVGLGPCAAENRS
jgi:phosphonate metabolism protein (transferase hexapeptide repeat family)